MFSKACEYGIRALCVIAEAGEKNHKIGIKEICEISKTPESFTAKILQNLVKRGFISSQKGPSGGFFIDRRPDLISLYSIVEAIDGDEVFKRCGLGLPACNANNPCAIHFQFEKVRNNLNEMCMKNTLADLLHQSNKEVKAG
ncbi:RrF2 family transcriptional regulator [Membranihabitans marinus]|uniref:RrF2 family transcriptional regulator n=1 Tax=Membranihabitans marinus TaxID=1227546 RepID=UPI001F1B0212|nr:Rrf2 family transcriptional regulator [Membranihabitans marinus]